MRNTVKAYLKSVEKNLADDRAKVQADQASPTHEPQTQAAIVADAQAEANQEVENGTIEVPPVQSEDPNPELATPAADIQPSIEVGSPMKDPQDTFLMPLQDDEGSAKRQASDDTDANDDEVEIQVEPSAEDGILEISQQYELEDQEQSYENVMQDNTKADENTSAEMTNGMESNNFNTQNMSVMNFNNMGMDMNMMQQMMNMNQMMCK